MKRYLKTPEEIAKELKEGKEVLCDTLGRHYKYKIIDGVIFKYNGNSWVMNGCLGSLDKPYIDELESLNLEVGKFYKTRDGRKAWVVSQQKDEQYPYIVAILGEVDAYSAMKDGSFFAHRTSVFDIVAPWEETK